MIYSMNGLMKNIPFSPIVGAPWLIILLIMLFFRCDSFLPVDQHCVWIEPVRNNKELSIFLLQAWFSADIFL